MSEEVGRIREIWRFPIKSFQGESVLQAALGPAGIFGDRVLALRRRDTGKILSGKDARLGEPLLACHARYAREPVSGEPLPPLEVEVEGRRLAVDEALAACAETLGAEVEWVAAGTTPETYESYWPEIEGLPIAGATLDFPLPLAEAGSFADLEPLHLLTTASVAELDRRTPDSEIGVSRFRPSLLLDTGDATGFVENEWTGRAARLGSASLELGGATPRCIMTTRAQAGLPRDPSVLKALVRENRLPFMGMDMPCLGVYAKVTAPGEARVGDALILD